MLGVFVNTAAIIVGSLVGIMLKKGLPEKISKALTTAIGLAVMYIGIDGMLSGENTLVLVLSMVIGTVIGTALDLDSRLDKLGKKLKVSSKKTEIRKLQRVLSVQHFFSVWVQWQLWVRCNLV